jgi:hypothetical protein
LSKRLDGAYRDFDSFYPHKEEIERRFRISLDALAIQLAPADKNSPFLRKRLIYTQILSLVNAIFGLDTPLSRRPAPKQIRPASLAKWIKASASISNRTAPSSVLEASDRRTNDPKERKVLFDYLNKCF